MYLERYWHERERASVQALAEEARRIGQPLARVAVAWVLAQPAVTCALVGASRAAQLDDSLAAAGLALDAQTLARLDALSVEYRRGDALR